MAGRRAIQRIWLIFTLLVSGLQAISAQTRAEIDAIATALREQEFPRALELLHPALQASPNNSELWAMQGVAYSKQGQKQQALSSFQRSLKISPDYVPALQGAIQIEYEAGSKEAIPLLQRILRLRPADATSHGMLAVLEYQEGNCVSATKHFAQAGSLFDSQPTALHAYATCLVKMKQPSEGAKVLEQALELNPDDRHERRLLAAVQLLANQPNDALTTLGPLLRNTGGSDEADALELAATAYEKNKETPQAVNMLRQAILLDPSNVNLYLDFANLSYAHDSFQVGIDVVSDGINLQPKAAALYFSRGVLYVQLAEYDKGQSDFEKAYELDPSQSLSAAAQGLAAAQQDDLDRALEKVRSSLKRKPNDAILLYLLAEILMEKGAEPGTPEFKTAIRSASRAVALQPAMAPPRVVLAALYLQSGQYKEAIEQCRKALQSDPKNQTALYHLIQALRKTGERREIPELLKQLAALRSQAAREQSQRYQYKLVDEDARSK